ncbi:hypothetical protein MUU72_23170 [Streptomyces sp. RS10V-4]|uniref:hypothetical protein n=1 Tax=Streptomyces rhizoryzae TaxID=2932493 RepID=UPI002003715A|nr:hypothetical protein [Streptomyces rhizoryzae]MCK7625968.1 hypothetical protein [Streptomyces rhizoryzae]
MSGGSFFSRPTGPVQAGGQQTNVFINNQPAADRPRQRDPRRFAENELTGLDRRFVPPPGLGAARELLRRNRAVLLTGARGNGTRSAAKILLHELVGPRGRFHELSAAVEDDDGDPLPGPGDVSDLDRMLLDLSAADDALFRRVEQRLNAILSAVEDHRAYLVVVLPGYPGRPRSGELLHLVSEIGRPRERPVLRRHLRANGVPVAEAALDSPQLTIALTRSRMEEIAKLAALFQQAREREPEADFARWQSSALGAWGDRTPEVAEQVANELTTAPQRALLLATAMLHGARADAVHCAAGALLQATDHPGDDTQLLERTGLDNRLADIKAVPDSDRRVRFSALAYEPAVRTYFWNNHPPVREPVTRWVSICLNFPALDGDDRDRLVRHYAELALRTEPLDTLLDLVEQWATQPQYEQVGAQAATVGLETAVLDAQHGMRTRRKIYHWARGDLPVRLARVLITVCTDTLAIHHPDQAMVRLHHLARHRSPTAALAREALLGLASQDNRLYRRLLDRVTIGLTERPYHRDDQLFLQLADPARLTDTEHRTQPFLKDASVRAQLTECWRAVLSRWPPAEWTAPVQRWLAGCTATGQTDLLTRIIARAAPETLAGRLYVLALDWADQPDAAALPSTRATRLAVADALWQELDRRATAPSTTAAPA